MAADVLSGLRLSILNAGLVNYRREEGCGSEGGRGIDSLAYRS
jgi:hypothetical protein